MIGQDAPNPVSRLEKFSFQEYKYTRIKSFKNIPYQVILLIFLNFWTEIYINGGMSLDEFKILVDGCYVIHNFECGVYFPASRTEQEETVKNFAFYVRRNEGKAWHPMKPMGSLGDPQGVQFGDSSCTNKF